MGYFIVGTAGHIDHGKTSLVKALTGIDTDRLKEEKIRGITIETGYAYLKIPEKNITIGIIDVPGHEKFIKNMVSGIFGIDVLMLIISADESVMPQTVEHLEICKLLGIKRGFIVVTKIDLVDKDLLEIVKDDIKKLVKGTFLENSPIFFVSSVTNEGIPELKNYLIELATKISTEKPISSIFRLPVDRVFTLKGFGTIVTGTTLSGKIRVGDSVEILPENLNSKIRSIQVHETPVEEAKAGQRTALNLQGVEKDEIKRGSVVVQKGYFSCSKFIYAKLFYLNSNKKPLKNRIHLKFHIGTDVIPSEIILFDKKELKPGEETYCLFKLAHETLCLIGDKFIIRSFDDKFTLGGGTVIYPTNEKLKIQNFFKELSLDLKKVISAIIKINGKNLTTFNELLGKINAQKEKILNKVKNLKEKGEIIEIEKEFFIHREIYEALKTKTIEIIKNFHRKNPELFGIQKEELKTKVEIENIKLFNSIIDELLKEGKIFTENEAVKLKEFQIKLDDKKIKILEKIENLIIDGRLKPPSIKEISERLNLAEKNVSTYLNILQKEGKIVKISPEIFISKKIYDEVKKNLIDFLKKNGEISIKEFKEKIAPTSRKYIIPLLEHFDSIKLTMRVGDKRVLRT